MADLNIRGIEEDLLHLAKKAALDRKLSLKAFVTQAVRSAVGTLNNVHISEESYSKNHRRIKTVGAPQSQSKFVPDLRVPSLRRK